MSCSSRRARACVLLLLVMLLAATWPPATRAARPITRPAPSAPASPAPAPARCALYPIALSQQTLASATPGAVIADILEGTQLGAFGWLSWTGSPSEQTLVTSLTPPGDSATYRNPLDASDQQLSVGDWVAGRPGLSNSAAVRAALDQLQTLDITVPVWEHVSGQGARARFQITAFARVRLLAYALPRHNRLSVRFLGFADCNERPPLTLTLGAPPTVAPGTVLPYTVQVTNPAAHAAISPTIQLTLPDGTLTTQPLADLAPGASTTTVVTWTVPVLAPRGQTESEEDYLARLASSDGTRLSASALVSWAGSTDERQQSEVQQVHTELQVPILAGVTQFPSQLTPGAVVSVTTTIENRGRGRSPLSTVAVSNPDGTTTQTYAPDLAPGASTSLTTFWVVPDGVKSTTERDAAYQARLAEVATRAYPFTTTLTWTDSNSNGYGALQRTGQAQAASALPVLTLALDGPTTAAAGETISYTLSVANPGPAVAFTPMLAVRLPDGALQLVDLGSTLAAGAVRQRTLAFVVPDAGLPAGQAVRAQLTWQDATQQGYGPLVAQQPLHVDNSAPIAQDDHYVVTAGQPLTVTFPGVLANDHDPDGNPLRALLVQQPVSGTVLLTAQGGFVYVPQPGAQGTDHFLYRVTDGRRDSAAATVVIKVETPRPANHPPLVDAGADQVILLSGDVATTTLRGVVSDDGQPAGMLTSVWHVVSGPAPVRFDDTALPATDAVFERAGTYVLRLTGSDSALEASAEVTIVVATQEHLPDLALPELDAAAVQFDGQALQVSGTIAVTVLNAGPGPLPVSATLALFEDRSGNGRFDPTADQLLGSATIPPLAASASLVVTATLAGPVLFAGTSISAMADSPLLIAEADETNNSTHTGARCMPPELGPFSPRLEWQWTGSPVLPSSNQVMMAPVVIELDGDGIPDIVFSTFSGSNYTSDGHLRAISGLDGRELFTVTDARYDLRGAGSMAAGDLDGDGRPELLAVDESGGRIIAFEHDGAFKWRSPAIAGGVGWGGPALADLDHDGTPEVVVGRSVLNADGTLRWVGSAGSGNNYVGPLSLVADLDLDGSPEVVAGNTAYRADGSIAWLNSALPDGFNAVANFDDDAFAEVVVVGRGTVALLDQDGTRLWGPVALPGGGLGGAPTIADVDNDGAPEIGVAGASRYTVFETNGSMKWSSITQDQSSHTTGSAVFDFEGDGSAEIIYRDEVRLRIYRGSDGLVLWETPSSSGTTYELPVIVDVDADGNAEIVMVSNNYSSWRISTGIQVYGDASDRWVATRQLWNQHTYHITNVNDDGSIPATEINSWEHSNTYRLNTLTSACATVQPDLTASYVRRSSAGEQITLMARIGNGGGMMVPAGVWVAWYAGDPRAGGLLLGTSQTARSLKPGQFEDVSLVVPVGTTALPLWVVADDPGSGIGQHRESNEENNRYNSRVYLTNPPNQAPSVAAGPAQTTTLPTATVVLSGTIRDDGLPLGTINSVWTLVSGAGEVRFTDANAVRTEASFNTAGTYVLRLTASDGELSSSDEVTVTVLPDPGAPPPPPPPGEERLVIPGWIGSPGNGSSLSGVISITLVPTITLSQGQVTYWPASDPTQTTLLTTTGQISGGQVLATLDTTLLANDSYVIRLDGTDSQGQELSSGVLVTVSGEYKPGRVRFSVTDLMVPLAGLPIEIGRTYDSLERKRSGDFGHGWSLSVGSPRLEVDPANNVTLTLPDGPRVTFFFTPQSVGGVFGYLLRPGYTAEAGVYGTLTADGCSLLVVSGGKYHCFLDKPNYNPTLYTYTNPYGQVFVMGADGTLKSITDLNGNKLTFSAHGIVSSAGNLVVPFVRDNSGRITRITDPAGQVYSYDYDAAGNLATVTLPGSGARIEHTYDDDHLLLKAVDPRGHAMITTRYYPDGRLASETDALSNTTSYAYDLGSRTTATTFPDGGVRRATYDESGRLLQETDPLGRTTKYTYDANGNLVAQTDPLGQTTTHTYDGQGNRLTTTNALGLTSSRTYNQYGQVTSETDELDQTSSVELDERFLPARIRDSLGQRAGFEFSDRGDLLRLIDADGRQTAYTYDVAGNLLTETDALSQTSRYTYDLLGNRLTATDGLGRIVRYTYDALGNPLTVTAPSGDVIRYEYDINGNRTAEVDTLGRRTTFAYDAENRLTDVHYPDGSSIQFAYDWRGNILREIDQDGQLTVSIYDLAGQLVSVTYAAETADKATTTYAYDAAGRRISQTDALGHRTSYTYNALGHLIQVTDPLSQTTIYETDALGRTIAMTDALGRVTRYTYDTRGRQVTITYPDGTISSQSYDGVGNVVRSTDQAGRVTTYAYDELRRLIEVSDPLNHRVHYTYDAVGNITGITDPNGHRIAFAYDALNHLVRKTWPDGSFELYDYDAAGNLLRHRLADGQVNRFAYDAMDRLREAHYFDGQAVRYTYTSSGLRESVTDARGTTRYAYDYQARLTSVTYPDGQTISYTYDAVGNRLRMTTPVGTIRYTYDASNQLIKVTDPSGAEAHYQYDPVGLVVEQSLPNGITVDYRYDALNRLIALHQRRGDVTIASYQYTLDLAGNRLLVQEHNGRSIRWRYDDAYRLIEETRFDADGRVILETSFSYDAAGNRLTMTSNGQTTTYQYNVLDQLVRTGASQYRYDGRGNLREVSDGANVTRYTFDARDRLAEIALPNATNIRYTYDADGRRIEQQVGAAITTYVWDEASAYGDVVLERDGSGHTTASYVLAGAALLSQDRGGIISYYLYDGQGNVRTLADEHGFETDRYDYTAFGEILDQQGTTVNPYRYTGQHLDALTELYNLRARYYDPTLGRFLSRDVYPVDVYDPRELNRYVYVANNPINTFDPTGYAGFEYGRITTTIGTVTHAARVYGHRIGATIGLAKGAFDALDARLITQMIRVQLEAQRLLRAMHNLTVAQTTVLTEQGTTRVIVAINGAKRSPAVMNVINNVINTLRARGIDAFVADGDLHAEVAAYQRALTYTRDIVSIGISNSGGPCGSGGANCSAFFDRLGITVYYLGKLMAQR